LFVQGYATMHFSTVRYIICVTSINFPQSANSGKLIFNSFRSFYGANAAADCPNPELLKFL
jgi:hypothetical protein